MFLSCMCSYFFFRQKTAYELHMSDWSSDVCAADLADHHLAGALARLREQPRQLVVDLALQVAGVGGDPDRGIVALGPEAGRGQVAERLAGAGARLGQHHARLALVLARGEGGGRGGCRSEEHTSELQSLMRISYAVFCLKKNK